MANRADQIEKYKEEIDAITGWIISCDTKEQLKVAVKFWRERSGKILKNNSAILVYNIGVTDGIVIALTKTKFE